jgi:excisionase family DNA binding protein
MSSPDLASLRLYTVDEVSESTGLPVPTLRKLIATRAIPVVRIGAAVRFRATDLAQWLEANSAPALTVGGTR